MQDINIRLKKIIGQLSSIDKMIDENQNCDQIIIQFLAVKGALNSAFSKVLEVNLENCLQNKDEKSIKKILKLISNN